MTFDPATTISLVTDAGEIKTVDEIEMEAIEIVTALCRGNMSAVAAHLGIGRSTLYRKLANRPPSDTPTDALTTGAGA